MEAPELGRRLAVIVAADIEGYDRLMQTDILRQREELGCLPDLDKSFGFEPYCLAELIPQSLAVAPPRRRAHDRYDIRR